MRNIHLIIICLAACFFITMSVPEDVTAQNAETVTYSDNSKAAVRTRGVGGVKTSTGQKKHVEYSKRSARLDVICLRGEKEELLKDGDVITRNDNYAVSFKTTLDPFVYLFQIDSRGNMTQIFPNKLITNMDNPVILGKEYRIPGTDDWLFLDEVTGTEEIILLARREPIMDPLKAADQLVVNGKASVRTRGIGGYRTENPEADTYVVKRYFVHE